MALVLADRVKETTTTTGTGAVTLLGASAGYQSFAVIGDANTTYYTIAGQTTTEWEVGIGTYTSSGTTLARTTVLSSSNSGSLVDFTAGTKDVFVTYPSSRSVYADGATLTATNSSILPIASGGTGETTRQAAMDALAGAVTSGSYLRGNGADVVMSTIQAGDVPTLNQNTSGNATTATTATNIAGGVASQLPYQTGVGTTGFIANGTSGQLLQSNGAAVPSWVAAPVANNGTLTMAVSGTGLSGSQTFTANQATNATFTVASNATNANTVSTIVARDASGNFSAGTITAALTGNASTATSATSATTATTATNLAGGSNGTIPYQSAAGTTVQLAAGTSGFYLKANGAAAPSWAAVASGLAAASQAEMEAASSSSVAATPQNFKYSPSSAKVWLKCNVTGSIQASLNVSSVTDTGFGVVTVTIDTDFSSADYSISPGVVYDGGNLVIVQISNSPSAGSFVIKGFATNGTEREGLFWYAACFGDQ